MNKLNWKDAIKYTGIFLCMVTFITLAVVIYLNRLEPLFLDRAMRDFSYQIRGEKFGFCFWFFRIITEFGNLYIIAIIILIVIIVTKCDYRAISISLGILLAVLLNVGLKEIYMRERPFADFRWMNEDSTSFPSGHSTAVGFLYPFIMYLAYHSKSLSNKWKNTIYVSCSIIIPLVMFSRLILGVHYFTDVIAGVSVGIMISCLAMLFYKICIKYDFMQEGLLDKILKSKKSDED
ncbi:MAG: phosphatase PAP2 family protein [Anaeroplasmataceae bacterium]|nr:phosphatase PAP2 family protein [Anaeroplasmataceae bacterium]